MAFVEKQLEELIDAIDEFVIVLNATGQVVTVNEHWINFCKESGWPDALRKKGGDYLQVLRNAGRYAEIRCIEQVINGKLEEYAQLYSCVIHEKTEWLSIKVRSILLEDDTTGAVLFQKVRKDHRFSQIEAEQVLNHMTEAFFLVDSEQKFSYLNSTAEKMLNHKKEDMLGQVIWDIFPEAMLTELYSKYYTAVQEQKAVQADLYYEPLKGWFDFRAYPLNNGELAVYFMNIDERKATEQKLEEFAYFDYLTGLPNRRKILKKLNRLLDQKVHFALCYVNLDNLKIVNTLYNHKTGDELLKSIAFELENLLPEQDAAGRLDGDEFILIHVMEQDEDIKNFANKIKARFTQPFLLTGMQSVSVSASIGISSCPDDAADLEELFAYAETAMFEAKKEIGASYTVFSPQMTVDSARRMQLERDLAGDLNNIGLSFMLQPQLNTITDSLYGVEVLARWNHPELGSVSPLEFIKIAEETGTISRLTYHLLMDVFAYMQERERRYDSHLRTAINITPSLLSNKSFFDDFFELLDQFAIPPELIEIEITENAELTYSETTLQNMMACERKGISIAIDDFGTGFSMLSYLTQYPIRTIKLDHFFVQKVGQNKQSEEVLRGLIHFVQSIGYELIAEGVETAQEADFLLKHGCAIHQGYLYDRPMTPENFDEKYLGIRRLSYSEER